MIKRRIIVSPLVNTVASAGGGKNGVGKHLEPGVVKYDNGDGTSITYLLPLKAIEKMRPTAAGKPVVGKSGGFDHAKIEPGKKYDGVAVDSFWDGESGWEAFHFDEMNEETAKACKKGFQVSCAYIPTDVDETPGLWHNIPYDAIILDGEYTHFAVVPNPRYEGATIEILNSLNGGIVNKVLKAALSLVPFAQLKEVMNSLEDDAKKKLELEKKNADEKAAKKDAAKKDFDASMLNAKTDEEKAAAQAAFEKKNAEIDAGPMAEPAADLPPEPLGGGGLPAEPGVPGQQSDPAAQPPVAPNAAPVETPEQAQLREKAALEKKNADEAAAKAAAEKEAKDKADKAETERKNALELKNKAEADAKKRAEARERFNSLRKLAEERGGTVGTPFVGILSTQEKEDLGQARYGSR